MALLEEMTGQPAIDLQELFGSNQNKKAIPEATARNRSSMAALLSEDPMQIENTFNLMMMEAEQGSTDTLDRTLSQAKNQNKQMDYRVAAGIIGDPSIPLEQKQAAIDSLGELDSSVILTNRIASQDVKGDNAEQEMMRMMNAEQALGPTLQYRKDLQGVMNAHAASFNADTIPAVIDFMEILLPFSVNEEGFKTLGPMLEELKAGTKLGATLLPGSAMVGVREALAKVPTQQRIEVVKRLLNIIDTNKDFVINNDNDFIAYLQSQQALEEGGYSTFDKYLDNASGLLDIIGFGVIPRLLKSKPQAIPRVIRSATRNPWGAHKNTASDVFTVNPSGFRGMHYNLMNSEGNALSLAFTGMERDAAITHFNMPQMNRASRADEPSSVEARVPDPAKDSVVVDEDLMKIIDGDGGAWMTMAERRAAEANFIRDVYSATGLHVIDNMTRPGSVGIDGANIAAKVVFGTPNGGFSRAEDAMNQAQFALKEYGITEKDLTILKRSGDEYLEVPLSEVRGVDGEYLVQMDFNHRISSIDVLNPDGSSAMSNLDVKRNFFDRIPSFVSKDQGSLSRYLFDAASMLHKTITGGAERAGDVSTLISKHLLDLHNDFSKSFMALKGDRRSKLYEHIKEANFHGLELDDAQLKAQGFFDDEINTLKKWRKSWDTHYFLENRDLTKTLRADGYEMFANANDKFFVKKAPKDYSNAVAYDPATQTTRTLTRQEIDDIYNRGGNIHKLRRPEDIGNATSVENIIIRNTPTEYARAIRDFDKALEYRKGYYQVSYKAPKFVYENVWNQSGTAVLYTRAVAVAGTTEEATHFLTRQARMAGVSPERWGGVRSDVSKGASNSDTFWELQSASGRIAQRHRGKTLQTSNGLTHIGNTNFIADPVESAMRAARSLAGRVGARDMLEFAKQRAMQQYERQFNGKRWPSNAQDIGRPGEMFTSEAADARSTWEYLNYLENGYINTVDAGIKNAFNALSEFFAGLGMSKAERAAGVLSDVAPIANMRAFTFHALIGTAVIRQWVVQAHQIVRSLGYDPLAAVQAFKLMSEVGFAISTGRVPPNIAEAINFIRNSGMLEGIDQHNLIRGALSDARHSTSNVRRGVGKARLLIDVPRRVGFDTGETINLMFSLLVEYQRMKRKGLNVNNKALRDESYSKARAITGSMSFAGDMPYNQTWPSLMLQFMQVPHKFLLQGLTNRRLTKAENLRLLATDAAFWGIPGVWVADMLGADILPEDPELREKVRWGLESFALNKVFSQIAGEDVRVDFSSLSPYDITGWAKVLTTAATEGPLVAILNSPSMKMFFGTNPRVTDAFKRTTRYFGLTPHEDLKPEDAMEVVKGWLKISSGMSAVFNYHAIKTISAKVNDKGQFVDRDVNSTEALFALAGFGTIEQRQHYETTSITYQNSKAYKDDIIKFVDLNFKVLAENGNRTVEDQDLIIDALNVGRNVYANDPVALGIYNAEVSKRLMSKDDQMVINLLRYAQIPTNDDYRRVIEDSSLSQDKKERLLSIADDFRKDMKVED